MSFETLGWVAVALAALPLALSVWNLAYYRSPPSRRGRAAVADVSVLIPARDEEASIRGAVAAALASRGVRVEVIVLDDHSSDGTSAVVRDMAARDPRVRLRHAPPLPQGWCGKQHACSQLARFARHDILVFQDADVRLSGDGLERLVGYLEDTHCDLLSGIPWQETRGLGERLVIPLIHFVLLGFLPMARMRRSTSPAFGAGCGQLFVARRTAYERTGGHAAIAESIHDGLSLPRLFRTQGLRTDLVDASRLATCRMYRSFRALWCGFAKNAHEGMGSPAGIVPWSVLLLGGQVLPALVLTGLSPAAAAFMPFATAVALAYANRLLLALRFRQSWLGAALHPLGVALVVAIQWYGLARRVSGRPVTWKGRAPA